MLLYVTLVSLKRATYSKRIKKKSVEDKDKRVRASGGETVAEDKRTAVYRNTYIH